MSNFLTHRHALLFTSVVNYLLFVVFGLVRHLWTGWLDLLSAIVGTVVLLWLRRTKAN